MTTAVVRDPLRVLYVVPDLGIGGAERHVTTLLPGLDRSRFTPSAICIGRAGALFPDLVAAGVPVRALGRTKREALLALLDLVREMRRTRPDIVIVRGYNAEVLGRIAAAVTKVPRVVVWVHNHGDTTPRGFRRVVDRLLDRVTDAYYGVAEAQMDYLTKDLGFPPAKVRVIYNGVDPVRFDPIAPRDPALLAELGIAPDESVVGVLAALRPEKDHAMVLEAFRIVVDAMPAARLLIVGDGVERSRLEKLAADLGLTERVIFAGNRSDIPAVLGLVDVIALGSYTIECFPMALLESMASGRPAVCTAVGGVSEMVEAGVTGYLVPPRDPGAFAERLLALLQDPDTARRFGAAARAVVEARFSLEQSVRAAAAALEETAGRGHGVTAGRPVRLTLVLDATWVGGAETVLLETFRNFDPAVVRPRVICLRFAGPLADEFRASGFEVEVLDRSGRFDLRRVRRLVRSLRSDRTDVVLVSHHFRAALVLGPLAARLVGARSVIAAHDMDLTSVGQRCLPRSTVATLFLSDALVLLAPAQEEYLRREEGVGRRPWSTTRKVVIPNGIRILPPTLPEVRAEVRDEFGFQTDDVVVGVVARLSAQKAHQVLFRAAARLTGTVPNLRLLVIGGGPREEELKALADELGIVARFVGLRRDVPRLLAGTDISCLSSVHEGVPLTVLEAMAAGLPVVATECGALRDLIEEDVTGHLVPVGDVSALSARLSELARDPALRARLGTAGRLRAERDFGIQRTADGYTALLTSLVAGR